MTNDEIKADIFNEIQFLKNCLKNNYKIRKNNPELEFHVGDLFYVFHNYAGGDRLSSDEEIKNANADTYELKQQYEPLILEEELKKIDAVRENRWTKQMEANLSHMKFEIQDAENEAEKIKRNYSEMVPSIAYYIKNPEKITRSQWVRHVNDQISKRKRDKRDTEEKDASIIRLTKMLNWYEVLLLEQLSILLYRYCFIT
jgi:hypothetical protein